nr:amino acid permease 6 [Quercus suber]
MESAIDSEFQHEICESGLDNIDRQAANGELDDDGKPKRTGTVWTASARIITAVISTGVLSLAWSVAQLGWIVGISIVLIFAAITLYTANLLADCYRCPDPITGRRNYTYMEAVQNILGGEMSMACGLVQNMSLIGILIGHTITTSTSMVVAAIMSFGYASIGIGLSFARDTLKSSPPENKVMKKANTIAISTMTVFFLMCGCLGYAAFGNEARGNMLTGFGFYEPFWLIDLGNIMIVVHLLGSYQVIGQPVFRMLELWASMRWPNSKFVYVEYPLNIGKIRFSINFLRLIWRTIFVVIITVLAMAMPFFNEMLSLLGAIAFWPVAVYFPVEMYIAQKKIRKRTFQWFGLQILSLFCFLVSLAAACGAIQGLNKCLHASKAFQFKQ